MEPQPFALKMQHEMIAEIETNAPEFIVYSTIDSSWQRRPDSKPDIFNCGLLIRRTTISPASPRWYRLSKPGIIGRKTPRIMAR